MRFTADLSEENRFVIESETYTLAEIVAAREGCARLEVVDHTPPASLTIRWDPI